MNLYKKVCNLIQEKNALSKEVDLLNEEIKKRDIKIYNRDLICKRLRENEAIQSANIKKLIESTDNYKSDLNRFSSRLKDFNDNFLNRVGNIFVGSNGELDNIAHKASDSVENNRIRLERKIERKIATQEYIKKEAVEVNDQISTDIVDQVSRKLSEVGLADIKHIPSIKWNELNDKISSKYSKEYFVYCYGGCIKIVSRSNSLKELERTSELLKQLQSKNKGKNCVVVGNGPSLNKHDFNAFKDCFFIGSNYIYLNYKKMGFLPGIISATNYLVVEQRLADFVDLKTNVILPLYMYNEVGSHPNVFYLNINHEKGFSTNLDEWASTRSTVTNFNLQLAYRLGFQKVYLIGVDNTYSQSVKGEGKVIDQDKDDCNHFTKDYFKGLQWQSADTTKMEEVYQIAKVSYENDGRSIINAGIGGNLDCFERLDYRKIKKATKVSNNTIIGNSKVVISINPDLCTKFGHYLQFDDCFSQTLCKAGSVLYCLSYHQLDYYVNTKFARIIPVFKKKSHELGMRDRGDGGEIKRFKDEFLDGFKQIKKLRGNKKETYSVFMYCGSFQHIEAFEILCKENSDIHFYINMFFPSFETCFNRNSDKLGKYLLNKIRKIENLTLMCGTQTYLEYFRNRFDTNCELLPCAPTTPRNLLVRENRDIRKLSISFLGNMRPEKGRGFSLDVIGELLNDSRFDDYYIRVRKPKDVNQSAELEALDIAGEGRVDWIEGEIDIEEFAEFLVGNAVNVITYEIEAFRMRPSGVFSDSVVGEVPVLVPDDTDMARIVNQYDNGESYEEGNVKSLLDNLSTVVNNLDRYRYGCSKLRTFWDKENSWEKFVDIVNK
tara:strand:+ start:37920 stop:40418 length:2499 start_codon:yes stop_codon:yes gene_type:complete